MTVLKFKGILELGTDCRVSEESGNGAILIDGRDLVLEVAAAHFPGPVSFAFRVDDHDHELSGTLTIDTGWGYSEYTPMDSDRMFIKDGEGHDLIALLSEHANKQITVWVADEPFTRATE